MDEFLIPDTLGGIGLRITRQSGGSAGTTDFNVQLFGRGLDAGASVYCPGRGFAELFEHAAREWRGWDGVMRYESIEGSFVLECTQDRLGHVFIQVTLSGGGTERPWRAEAMVRTEAGQLTALARSARRFEDRS
mgnify:CR=1 FL=1